MTQSQSGVAYFCKVRVNRPAPNSHLFALDAARRVIADLTGLAAETGCRTVSLFNMFSAIGTEVAIRRFRQESRTIVTSNDVVNPSRTVVVSLDGDTDDDEFIFWALQVICNSKSRATIEDFPGFTAHLSGLTKVSTADLVQATFFPTKRVLSSVGLEVERAPAASFADWHFHASTGRRPTDVICYMDGDGMNRAVAPSTSEKVSLFARHAAAVRACRYKEKSATELCRMIFRSRMETDGLFDDLVQRLLLRFREGGVSAAYLGGDELIAAGDLDYITRAVEALCAQSELEIGFSAGLIPFDPANSSEAIALPLEDSLASTKSVLRGAGYFNLLKT